MKTKTTLLILAISLSAACAQKQKSGEIVKTVAPEKQEKIVSKIMNSPEQAYKCEVNKDTRLIEFDQAENRCEIHYTKFGEKTQVAWAESTPSICSDVFSKIRSNIEAKGFKCHSLKDTAEQKTTTAENKRDAASITQ